MDEEEKYWEFIKKWIEAQHCTFILDCFDGRESEKPIDGMAPDDVWGWLLHEGEEPDDDKNFGCIIWKENNGKIELEWKTEFP